MKLSDFDFDLPETLIATRPAVPRTSARLLVAQGDLIHDQRVGDLTAWLRAGDRLVLNDTRVIPARLFGVRVRDSSQGRVEAKIEVTLLEPRGDGTWSALIKPLRKLKLGEVVTFSADLSATLEGAEDGQGHLRFNCTGEDFDAALNDAGAMPLPPYIAAKRPADAQDKTDYQTVWAKNAGAVAAPTASLHFDEGLLVQLSDMGVTFSYVTLHVGAGTFLPVKVDDIADHKMHSEWGSVSAAAADEIAATKAAGGRIIPVGTTALRLIETAGRGGQIAPWEGDTDIFITPGFSFNVADALMTNFHLPKSTLMMLVAALMGVDRIKSIYDHAVAREYRFFSYGDASLLLPPEN
ncbi:tRNA preQ1(34) S-adenosylmethionine ribosyltransferase-isomerase QueA [Sulfitobacter sp. M57]|uniref:tRNA preQ1(34) S-adenosylmethionine ribosyltransferase-isomerase QueA n=1 Tax=unclassified Sulfitobacter TaxID=196795 RepID=UPI0023E1C2AC|nr:MULTISPECIES: tRNA preQ1(34) S-adenosylmethionine ribosyltransferase-isomerase QueA [unclassified Sulfitobacter]MDF3413464.1 tRNA preQ1(34) S-adenosylmethionine ribosyltransferase-isomerase QueA [Sulfitobacter sp. KE5]MDF3421256.1 tRNA preQ1(34) S-adenosylmethionine ribosyltransferase-isomerase QueA [Sulfitobacter sp. KE43]MDF3432011.1 tRNA preQ1(34) S-adenosylmethionine ribosyltransferase-isomerase QueA [Sulfitobacter sp. KE42]MDF3457651.1 tRNA preQ1(34) S-adenosylmethionine ribosyltransfer